MPTSSNAGGAASATPKEKSKPNQKQKQKRKEDDIATLPFTSIVQGQVSRLPIVFTRDAE
jgi:hypothetical protein